MIRVAWFIPRYNWDYNRVQSGLWIRCFQLIPYLNARGVRYTINKRRAKADIAYFVRWQDERAYQLACELKQKGQRIVFDLCVNYFDETGLFEGGYGSPAERVAECKRMIEVADAVTCASAFIAQRAQAFHPWVIYLPDSIDARYFRFRKNYSDFFRQELRAIWSGVHVKARENEPILPLLRDRSIPLTVITNEKQTLSMPYHFVRWTYESFPYHILEGELCVVYRPVDNPYNLGHSLFKIGVFLAQGVPVIASPLPSYGEVLGDGEAGRLCSTIAEWEEALDAALRDRELLIHWSEQARLKMTPYYTERVADKYVELFTRLCDLNRPIADQCSWYKRFFSSNIKRLVRPRSKVF